MANKAPPVYKLPPLPRIRVRRPVMKQETNRCMVLMSNLLQCWASNGHMDSKCADLVKNLKDCTRDSPRGTEVEAKRSNINYHAARLHKRISGKDD
ncbi:40S ribosomal protein mrp10 [Hanseniaspora osmophila]